MKQLNILFFLVLGCLCYAQSQKEEFESVWGNLNEIVYNDCTLYYKEGLLQNIEPKTVSTYDYDYTDIASFDINGNAYAVSFIKGNGPQNRSLKKLAIRNANLSYLDIYNADTICIPNKISIYVKHNERYGTISEKYTYQENKYYKTEQPFYYLGTNVIIRASIDIFSDDNFQNKIATIASESNVLVIGIAFNKDSSNPFLIVKSVTGITGYVKPKIIYLPSKSGEMIKYDFPIFDRMQSFAG